MTSRFRLTKSTLWLCILLAALLYVAALAVIFARADRQRWESDGPTIGAPQ